MTHSPTTAPLADAAPKREAAPASSKRRPLALALATLAVAALLILSLSTGEYSILSQDDGWQIFLAVRVPRTIALVLSGAAMSMSGLVMQLVTQNRFAEPSTTGTTEWAGLGLLVIMIVWPGAPILVRMTCAIVFAFVGTMVFFALLRRVSLRSSLLVPIMGMMLGAVVSAISTFVALETNTLQSVSVWFQGSFTSVYEGQYEVLWIVTVVVAIVFIMADRLTAVSLGEDIAISLGVNYHRMVLVATGLVAVATGVVTVVVGSLPFLGLIVPNLVSMSMGDNLRTNLPWVCLAGIALVTVTDLLARTIIPPPSRCPCRSSWASSELSSSSHSCCARPGREPSCERHDFPRATRGRLPGPRPGLVRVRKAPRPTHGRVHVPGRPAPLVDHLRGRVRGRNPRLHRSPDVEESRGFRDPGILEARPPACLRGPRDRHRRGVPGHGDGRLPDGGEQPHHHALNPRI